MRQHTPRAVDPTPLPRAILGVPVVGLLIIALLACAGCQGVRLAPEAKVAAGWRATPELTGPAVEVGLGTYEAGAAEIPFADPANPAQPVPSQPDPALVQALRDLDAKQAAAAERLASLDAKVASGALTEAQAAAIRSATKEAEALAAAAREAADRAAKAAADVPAAPGIPTDWTPAGLLAAAVGAAGWLMKRKLAAAAKAEAAKAAARAVEAFDRLPESATDAEVREAVRAPAP